MDKKIVQKFPKPFEKPVNQSWIHGTPHYMSPRGMLLPREMQPPPMFGVRGSTVPAKYLPRHNFNKTHSGKPYQKRENSYCVTCDREFKSSEELNNHKREHRTCGIDGCRFVGHPEAIIKHVEVQHNSGLFEKLKNLNTPEDIEKWRNDRKRRYPTQGNIELRQKIQDEKMQRGERLSDPNHRFGRKEDRTSCRGRGGGGRRGNRGGNRMDSNRGKHNKKFNRNRKDEGQHTSTNQIIEELNIGEINAEDQIEEFNGTLPRFKGTSVMCDYKKIKSNIEIINPLAGLLGMYGSDDDSDSNEECVEEKSIPIEEKFDDSLIILKDDKFIEPYFEHQKETIDQNLEIKEPDFIEKNEGFNLSDSEKPEECLIAKKDDGQPLLADLKSNEDKQSENTNKRKRYKRKNSKFNPDESLEEPTKKKVVTKKLLNYTKLKNWRPNTLLSKLLQPDIRHERNVLLQCVRHVVKNQFFGIGQKIELKVEAQRVDSNLNETITFKDESILLNDEKSVLLADNFLLNDKN